MDNPQQLSNITFNSLAPSSKPEDVLPNGPGVDFTTTNESITATVASGVTPILYSVSGPIYDTNVNTITVTVTSSTGQVILTKTSPPNTNTITDFEPTPLPEGSVITVTLTTKDGAPAENVTLSIIACYTPSTAPTIVTTGTPSSAPSGTTTGVPSGTPTGSIVYTSAGTMTTAGTGPTGTQTSLIISSTTTPALTGSTGTDIERRYACARWTFIVSRYNDTHWNWIFNYKFSGN
jgi:hypothetical protein